MVFARRKCKQVLVQNKFFQLPKCKKNTSYLSTIAELANVQTINDYWTS